MAKTVEYYMALPYTRELVPDATVGWGIKIKELPGCMSQGETPEEALRMIEDAMFGWLESEIEAGSPIPEPRVEEAFSGKFVVRVPRQLHRLLVESAESNNVSLNQLINGILAQGIEQR
ncbi:MAG TPA: toxin-antitoxin system HicB family antitoxin, partial [Anaerolineaceae bacterium]